MKQRFLLPAPRTKKSMEVQASLSTGPLEVLLSRAEDFEILRASADVRDAPIRLLWKIQIRIIQVGGAPGPTVGALNKVHLLFGRGSAVP